MLSFEAECLVQENISNEHLKIVSKILSNEHQYYKISAKQDVSIGTDLSISRDLKCKYNQNVLEFYIE